MSHLAHLDAIHYTIGVCLLAFGHFLVWCEVYWLVGGNNTNAFIEWNIAFLYVYRSHKTGSFVIVTLHCYSKSVGWIFRKIEFGRQNVLEFWNILGYFEFSHRKKLNALLSFQLNSEKKLGIWSTISNKNVKDDIDISLPSNLHTRCDLIIKKICCLIFWATYFLTFCNQKERAPHKIDEAFPSKYSQETQLGKWDS